MAKVSYEVPAVDPKDPSVGGPVSVTNGVDRNGNPYDAGPFGPGVVTPKSEREEDALELLAAAGLVKRVKG